MSLATPQATSSDISIYQQALNAAIEREHTMIRDLSRLEAEHVVLMAKVEQSNQIVARARKYARAATERRMQAEEELAAALTDGSF
jgi:hypothetical protein